MPLEQSQDYSHILLNNAALLDVRAPVEFQQGAFPNSTNCPLLNDDERHQVGLCYKTHGQQQAIELGHQLVSGAIKQQRIDNWLQQLQHQPNNYLYCYRGGLRSAISQQWLHTAGVDIVRVKGGYKAMRHFLGQQMQQADSRFDYILVGGLTGCRKTTLVAELAQGIDLEAAAYHRGSSFGAHATAQNSQIDFEHILAIDLLRAAKASYPSIVLEDEGRFIGSVDIPKNIFAKMRTSPLVVIERDLQERVLELLKEYVINMLAEYQAVCGDEERAFVLFSQYLLASLQRICKRLGQRRWQQLDGFMRAALQAHQGGDLAPHEAWLKLLLTEYYDPMYRSQLDKRKDTIVFRGDLLSCKQYIQQHTNINKD